MEEMDGLKGGEYSIGRILPEETWGLRSQVLWPEKQPDSSCALEVDGDPDVFHLGVMAPVGVVGIGTFVPQVHAMLGDVVGYRLRAMATHPNFRGRRVGAMLVHHAEEVLKAKEAGGIWADARRVSLGFYARLGWEVSGPFYTVPKRGLHRLVWTRFDGEINR